MTKIDIISGFLGAGKTTLIKRLLADALKGEQVVLIENEFGEIGIDGGFLKDAGIVVNEMNAGCICCSLVGDFGKALHDVVDQYHPDRILIEPSGVGKLSDVIAAVQNAHLEVQLNSFVTVVDALKAKMYLKNFGEFFENQVAHAGAILLSRTAECPEKRLDETVAMLRGLNEHARIVTTPWKDLTGEQLLSTMEGSRDLVAEVLEEIAHEPHHEHHHHHHDHEHDEHEHEHEHDHEEHEHHHECGCGHHHHDHEFSEVVFRTDGVMDRKGLDAFLSSLPENVDRAKGQVVFPGETLYLDVVGDEISWRRPPEGLTGTCLVFIGRKLDEKSLQDGLRALVLPA